jgi:hypothetical protein
LPFTSLTTGNSESSAYLGITRNLGSAHNNLRAYVNETNTVMQLPVNSTSSGFSGLPASDLQNTTQILEMQHILQINNKGDKLWQ